MKAAEGRQKQDWVVGDKYCRVSFATARDVQNIMSNLEKKFKAFSPRTSRARVIREKSLKQFAEGEIQSIVEVERC